MKIVKNFVIATMLAFAGAGCQQPEIGELMRDIDQLDHRVKALETQVQALNDNVDALSKLLNGATINSVSESDGTYTITLSNGEEITLTQGSEGGYQTPVVSVDSDGYWQVSFDGTQFTRVTGPDGKPVRAVAEKGGDGLPGADGLTPKFKVDNEGYWMVSYDNGTNYERVTDTNNQPVKATEGRQQDKFFADVKVEDDAFVFEMLNGQTYRIPIISDFLCKIDNSEEVVYFAQGETRQFDVEMLGVTATIVTAPEGWAAELKAKANAPESGANHTLSVTSPAAKSRATADSRIDLSILAVSQSGLSTIAKMAVATNDLVLHTPRVVSVTIDGAQTTETSLTFSVETDDAKGWKYLYKLSTEDAPDAQTVFETGTEGSEGSVTVNNLTHSTSYTIYVVAYYDSTVSTDVGKAEARTARGAVDYYEDGVEIGGKRYDKSSPNAKLITTTTAISSQGVYFLDPQDGAEITIAKITATDLVIIGRHSLQRAKVKMTTGPISLGNGNGLILKNVELDASSYTAYIFNYADGITANNFIIEDSKIISPAGKQVSNFNYDKSVIHNIAITNSIIKLSATANDSDMRIMNFTKGKVDTSLTFENTIIYAENGFVSNGALVHIQDAAMTTDNLTVKVNNCSFINYVGGANAYIYLPNVKSVDYSKNIAYIKDDYSGKYQSCYVLKFHSDNISAQLEYEDNICYGPGSFKYFSTNSKYIPNEGSYTKSIGNPFSEMNFETETFTPVDAEYGAAL